jgi:hypothetical protein
LNVLAENDVETGIGEGQCGDICLANGNPLVESDKSIEPVGRMRSSVSSAVVANLSRLQGPAMTAMLPTR